MFVRNSGNDIWTEHNQLKASINQYIGRDNGLGYVRLLSPQTYHHMHCGYSAVYNIQVSIYLTDNRIHIPIDI